jgi:hypothetical protein
VDGRATSVQWGRRGGGIFWLFKLNYGLLAQLLNFGLFQKSKSLHHNEMLSVDYLRGDLEGGQTRAKEVV